MRWLLRNNVVSFGGRLDRWFVFSGLLVLGQTALWHVSFSRLGVVVRAGRFLKFEWSFLLEIQFLRLFHHLDGSFNFGRRKHFLRRVEQLQSVKHILTLLAHNRRIPKFHTVLEHHLKVNFERLPGCFQINPREVAVDIVQLQKVRV